MKVTVKLFLSFIASSVHSYSGTSKDTSVQPFCPEVVLFLGFKCISAVKSVLCREVVYFSERIVLLEVPW